MITNLELNEIAAVNGAGDSETESILVDATAGTIIGASVGFLLGGPVGAAALGYAGGSLTMIVSSIAHSND